jgi:hypothetical protein
MGIAADRLAQPDKFRQIQTPVTMLNAGNPGVMDG